MRRITITIAVFLLSLSLAGLAIAQGPVLIGTIEGTPAEDAKQVNLQSLRSPATPNA